MGRKDTTMVRKGDQTSGDMRVVSAAKELVSYTLDRTNDRNIFPKSQRGMSAQSVWDSAFGVLSSIIQANRFDDNDPVEVKDRLRLEQLALGHLETLAKMIDILHMKKWISDDRQEYWAGLCDAVDGPLKGWIKSTKRKCNKINQ